MAYSEIHSFWRTWSLVTTAMVRIQNITFRVSALPLPLIPSGHGPVFWPYTFTSTRMSCKWIHTEWSFLIWLLSHSTKHMAHPRHCMYVSSSYPFFKNQTPVFICILPVFLLMSFSWSRFHPGHHIAFHPHVSLVPSDLWQFLSLPLYFMPLALLKSLVGSFVECSSPWVCLMFPHD